MSLYECNKDHICCLGIEIDCTIESNPHLTIKDKKISLESRVVVGIPEEEIEKHGP
jgi:hypothetical protein